LFDPAGWLAPFIIRSKMFMQEIWLQNLGWDDKLPTEMSQRWQSFLDEYSDLNQIRVPRWIWYQPEVIIEHHGFCDASQRAYGAAIYIRVEMGQKILTRLLTAKARVAPVKTVSLLRLELCGAVLLTEMVTAILPHMPSASSDIRCRTSTFRLNVVLKIDPSLRIRTPIRALSDAARAKFDGVRLADERFHRPASISLVLGSDVYANLIQPGFLKIEDGLPVAQNTVFGWTVSGTCAK